jgi:hypothetical protein
MDTVHRVLVMSAFLVLLSGPESGLAQTPEATSIPQLQSTFSIAAVDSDHLESVWVEQLWWRYPLIGFGIGAAAGGLYGLYADLRCGGEDNWFCGTYTVSYAVIGGVVGAVTGSVLRFGRRKPSRDPA